MPLVAADLSVHRGVLAALVDDARIAASLTEQPDVSSPLSAWLVGVSLRDDKTSGKDSTTRVTGVVRVTPGRPLSDDLAATTALLPGGVSVVGAAAALAPSSSALAEVAAAVAEAARAAAGGAFSSSGSGIAAATDPKSGETFWLCGGEPVEVSAADDEEAAPEALLLPQLSPAVAALSTPRSVDPWLSERFSSVRCGPLRVRGGLAGAAACLAELCGDGDDPGDAAFVAAAAVAGGAGGAGGSTSRGACLRPLLLAGDGPAPLSSSLLTPLLATPHSSPPPPPAASLRGTGPPPAPTAVFEPSASPSLLLSGSVELVLDALALYPKTATAGEAAVALRAALSRQLRAAMTMAAAPQSSTSPLRALPFLLPGLPVVVTPLMRIPQTKNKRGKEEAATTPPPSAAAAARASLGAALRLPLGLPLLRPSAAFAFAASATKSKKIGADRREKLLDVHLSLPSFSSKKKTFLSFEPPLPRTPTLSLGCVAGSYRYHHYGQDSKDDRGWGCAYRSLQTLWSWFAENHFLDSDDDDGAESRRSTTKTKSPPTHSEIQRALVDLGDKTPPFLGSNQWIGAMEISFVLEKLAGIESKVITVARGDEMSLSAAAGALVAHFRSQGTPVMIGGGVLAYTCLGCCFDPSSGEASFLILDPHYCGTSDAGQDAAAAAAASAAVVKGGWVAWKKPGDSAAAGGPLFVADAFYNLLCPQRPASAE